MKETVWLFRSEYYCPNSLQRLDWIISLINIQVASEAEFLSFQDSV